MGAPRRIVLCAGELSGDMHAAHVVAALVSRLPGVSIEGMGGENCARAGMAVRFEHRDYALIGFTGVLTGLRKFIHLERSLKALIDRADLLIAVDYPGLNLRLCAHAHRRGVPVLYYIAPQVWAWGEQRVAKIRRVVGAMAVVLPFEEEYFRRAGVRAEYVGHPFVVDHELPPARPWPEREWIALLPGSRESEVRTILPVLLEAACALRDRRPELRFVIGKSPVVSRELYQEITARSGGRFEVGEDAVDVLGRARAAMVASGTATLQAALLETPLVVVYRTSRFNYFLAKRLVRIPHVGLVNVLAGREVAREFVQGSARPGDIADEMARMLDDTPRREQAVECFRELRRRLGDGRGCARVAELAEELLA
jgi:lipid-A-disaccharide synthase